MILQFIIGRAQFPCVEKGALYERRYIWSGVSLDVMSDAKVVLLLLSSEKRNSPIQAYNFSRHVPGCTIEKTRPIVSSDPEEKGI